MVYTWRTREDGVIVTTDTVTGVESVLTLSGPNAELMEKIEARWGDLCRRKAAPFGLHDGWCQSFIFQESGGDEHARNRERLPGIEDDGVGLGQITAADLKKGFSDQQLQDPETNVGIMVHYMAALVHRYGPDFPKISAAYNAGSVRPPARGFANPWGMHCTAGHITAEVSALNYYLMRPLSESDRQAVLAVVHNTLWDFALHDLERGRTEPPEGIA